MRSISALQLLVLACAWPRQTLGRSGLFRSPRYAFRVAPACGKRLPLITYHQNRCRARRLLTSLTGERDGDRAAAIAAIVGGVGVEKAAVMAERTFRAIAHSDLRHDDLLNGDLASENDELRGRTFPCRLGAADAFMSHSWRDDAAAKWHTLGLWARAWGDANQGRSPLVWFDRAVRCRASIGIATAA